MALCLDDGPDVHGLGLGLVMASKSPRSHHKALFSQVTFVNNQNKVKKMGCVKRENKRKTQPMFHSAFKNVNTGVNRRYLG